LKISFVIPLYNCLSLTQAMLTSLRATVPGSLSHEIIFVDDGSTDGTRAWLAAFPQTGNLGTILNDANLGFAGACNRGAAAATGEYLFFLNNDLILQPRWLEPMLDAFRRCSDAGLVGNVQLNARTGLVDHSGIYFNHQGKPAHRTDLSFCSRRIGWPAYRRVPALTGACLAVRRDVWGTLGGFDPGFINGSEDVDLALRAAAAGFQHYVALRSIVRHHISASTGRKLRDEQNTRRLFERWRDRIEILAARDWSRHFIEQHWDQSFTYDDVLGREALACWLGLAPGIPSGVRAGVRAAMAVEFARWERLLPAA
jgi:O-antigen biosynthesis protein